ncbi:5506_t:CDS:10 [Funneliformis geosporum]|uniref:17125_t:CDS:1 n=1 Tax=Funneliformis geosporum TaxID=1117311 RepID=A0A9W4WM63_9GLOM|nr:17125_t:CDS:10 [Funneliformis geosporum]CAI2180024.1 5506_t:CDS:10 [Funneliformis geosporum]
MDIINIIETEPKSREEYSNEFNDIENVPTSTPQNDENRMGNVSDKLKPLTLPIFTNIRKNLESGQKKYGKPRSSSQPRSSSGYSADSGGSESSKKIVHLTNGGRMLFGEEFRCIDISDGEETAPTSQKKKKNRGFESDILHNFTFDEKNSKNETAENLLDSRRNELHDFDMSDNDDNAKQHSRRKSAINVSDESEGGFDTDFFSDDSSTKKDLFIKPDGKLSDDERNSNLNDVYSNRSKAPKKFSKKFKLNSLNYLSDASEESEDEDYCPIMSINDDNKQKEKSKKKESFYLDTDEDEPSERERKSKYDVPNRDELNTEAPMNVDGAFGKLDESILDDDLSLDDYIAVDKPTYSPKKKQSQRQIIIHEESSNITELQPPFQPGSSPMKNGRRYLAINWIGSILAVDNNTYHSINVEYNNKTLYKGYNLRDEIGYTMACLGTQGALFAVESDAENPSVLYYKPNQSWSQKSDWMTTLHPGEDITGKDRFNDQAVVVATSKNYLRFFSPFGFQNYIFSFPSIICMAAYNNFLLIAHHLSVAYKGSQNLGYVLYDMHERGDVQKDVLPISKESTLKWLGFSEEGLPVMFDSKGILFMLHDHRIYKQARWVPILDTANIVNDPTKPDVDNKSKKISDVRNIFDDTSKTDISENKNEKDDEKDFEERDKEKEKEWIYWPVAVIESKLICFILKYGEDVPRYPRPTHDEVNWQMPLLHLDKLSGRCEERWIRESILSSFQYQEANAKNELSLVKVTELRKKERDTKKIMIELIQATVSEERYERALELARLLDSTKFLESALKIANFYNVTSLAEKIHHLQSEKEKSKTKEREALLNRSMSYSNNNSIQSDSVLLSDLNHSSTKLSRSPPPYEDSPTNPLKRSVKDMNDEIQEVDEHSPKPKKSAIPISSMFKRKLLN